MEKIIVDCSTGVQTVVPCTAEEVAAAEEYRLDVLPGVLWNELRTKRNQLLAETDYLALADHTLSAEMTAYRQALRDLPANTTDPANPVFPTKPGA